MDESKVPVIVTNRHVLEDVSNAAFCLTLKDAAEEPMYGSHKRVPFSQVQDRCLYHSDPAVDLAVMFVGDILNDLQASGVGVYFRTLSRDQLPGGVVLDSIEYFEQVRMVGYPNGIWDEFNNLPISRRGYTATPYSKDYDGSKEFVLDAASFPGSSGSPVFLDDQNSAALHEGSIALRTRFALLGVLSHFFVYTAEGEIKSRKIPTSLKLVPETEVPLHLGLCVKSSLILDFEAQVVAKARKSLGQ